MYVCSTVKVIAMNAVLANSDTKATYRIHGIIGESNIWQFAKKSLLVSVKFVLIRPEIKLKFLLLLI